MVRLLAILVLLTSCALQSRKDQASLRSYFVQKDFEQAEKYLESSSLKEKDNRLLYLMDKGGLAFYQERFGKAAQTFYEANELVDRLYTKSIREMLASSIINDNSKTFYGSVFERSMLYYFQALSFYQLASVGHKFEEKQVDGKTELVKKELSSDDIRRAKNQVRSTLIAWDSFFKDLQRTKGAKTFLKDDYFAKMFAAQMHLQLNTRRDAEIALQLYKDALKIFDLFSPTLKTFNKQYKKYNGELRRYFDGKRNKKLLRSIELTVNHQKSRDYIITKILDLTKRVRKNKFKQTLRKFKLEGYEYQLKNVVFHIEAKTISPMEGKDYSFNLASAIDKIEDKNSRALINGIGVPILTAFALGPLGLGYVSHHGNVTIYSRHRAGEAMVKEVGVEFELPYAEANEDRVLNQLLIKQGEKLVKEVELVPIISLSDIAFINAQERIENSFNKRAARVGGKYALAMVAAYGTYKRMQKSNELFAKPAAMAQFLLSQKGIKESEKADVRHWTTLPNLILTNEVQLPPGDYKIFLKNSDEERFLRDISVKSKKKALFSHRVF